LHYVGDNKTDISVTVEDVEHAVNKLKFRKAAGIDGVVSEHILHSPHV